MRRRVFILAALLGLLAGCRGKEAPATAELAVSIRPPAIDRSEPGKAIDSIAKLNYYLDHVLVAEMKRSGLYSREYMEANFAQVPSAHDRDIVIDKITGETSDRATVTISFLTVRGSKQKETLTVEMLRAGGNWQLADVKRKCAACGGGGKAARRNDRTGNYEETVCGLCGGSGWQKAYLPLKEYH